MKDKLKLLKLILKKRVPLLKRLKVLSRKVLKLVKVVMLMPRLILMRLKILKRKLERLPSMPKNILTKRLRKLQRLLVWLRMLLNLLAKIVLLMPLK